VTGQIARFDRVWGTARLPFETRLITFVAQWQAQPNRSKISARRSVPSISDPAKLSLTLRDLHNVLAEARSRGLGFNPWIIAGLKRNEVRICGVLAALWNFALCGDAAKDFLTNFLKDLPPSKEKLTDRYLVRTEHSPLGEYATRMDITIEDTHFVIGVEVKIDAPEGGGDGEIKDPQFTRIFQRLESWASERGKRPYFILLSSKRPRDFSGSHADWRKLVHAARRSLPRKRAAYSSYHHLLASFAAHAVRL